MPTRVIVTAAGGALAPLNIRLMRTGGRHSIWVLAVDQRPDAAGRYFANAFATVPAGDAPDYVDAVLRLIETHAIDVVLPWSDEEALALASERERIEECGATLACAKIETLRTMSDKAESYRLLRSSGIRTPDFTIADSDEAFDAALKRHGARGDGLAIKPSVSRGNRGVILVRPDMSDAQYYHGSRELHMNRETFDRNYRAEVAETYPIMVSERLYPPAYDIDVLARQGTVMRVMPRERLNPAGVPFTGSILRPEPQLLDLADTITRALGLDWLYDYDIMRDADGALVVLELNPRPSGSIAAAIMAGVPFYDDLISLVEGETLPPIDLPEATAVIPYTDCRVVPLEALRNSVVGP